MEIKTLGGQGSITLLYIDGDETRITDVAGISKGRIPDGKPRPKLLRHLLEKQHMTPFESVQVGLYVSAPIYVARQWMRHRTWAFNEVSLRYVEAKQGSVYQPEGISVVYQLCCKASWRDYAWLLDMTTRPREQARGVLPLATMTQFWAQCDLRNLLHFLELRDDEHAQAEIREYAQAIKALLKDRLPTVASVMGW